MASFPGPIPPGEEGKITLKVKTANRGGKLLTKTATVITNDPKNPRIKITISGMVDRVYTISSRKVKLVGTLGEKLSQTVALVPEEKYPFSITKVHAKRGNNIRFQLAEVAQADKHRFEVTIENTRTEIGPYLDTVYLTTDSKHAPEITVNVFGNIQKPSEEKAN